MSKAVEDYVFRNRTGEVLIKPPSTIHGNGFVLDTLVDCEVYILDHTSQVQVDDCVNCKIFIGPCDGSVFIRDCKDCTMCVATRQLRTRDCKQLRIALYCATQPSIETSTNIEFACWNGAYPGLTAHFAAARLDPLRNTWNQVYDFNAAEDLGGPHFTLDEGSSGWWLAPVEGSPDCPVVAPDGALFGGGRAEPPPRSPGGGLPESLPPSPGRAQNWDEEVEIDDDEPPVMLAPGVDDGGVVPPQPPSLPPSPGAAATAAFAARSNSGAPVPPGLSEPSFKAFGSTIRRAEDVAQQQGAATALGVPDLGGLDIDPDGPGVTVQLPMAAAAAVPAESPALEQPADLTFGLPPVTSSGLGDMPLAPLAPAPAAAAADNLFELAAPPTPLAPPSPAPMPALDADAGAAAEPEPLQPFGLEEPVPDADAPPAPEHEDSNPFFDTPATLMAHDSAVAAVAAAEQQVASAAAAGGGGTAADADSRVTWRATNAARLAKQDAEERKAREQLRQAAANKIKALEESRKALLQKRHATHRTQQGPAPPGPGKGGSQQSGVSGWALVSELVDLSRGTTTSSVASAGISAAGASGGGALKAGTPLVGRDLTRLKQLMIALKAKQAAKQAGK